MTSVIFCIISNFHVMPYVYIRECRQTEASISKMKIPSITTFRLQCKHNNLPIENSSHTNYHFSSLMMKSAPRGSSDEHTKAICFTIIYTDPPHIVWRCIAKGVARWAHKSTYTTHNNITHIFRTQS